MTTPSMQQTSSASSADKLAELIRQIDGNHTMGAAALAEALLPHLAGIVPQVVQAPIAELLARYWDLAYVEGREGRNVDTPNGDAQQVLSAIKQLFRGAPIVATVPSNVQAALEFSRNFARSNPKLSKTTIEHIEGLANLLEKYAAPSTAEQASDVRNAVLDAVYQEIVSSGLDQRFMFAGLVRCMKSAPADKGNAPAEVKS